MQSAPDYSGLRADILAAFRAVRFASTVHCPRCEATTIRRWGTFSGRQRYRCGTCRKTFSDLTGTPAAYTKRLHLWPVYAGCMIEGCSIRTTAKATGISPSTAFRWRHAILRNFKDADLTMLAGMIELEEAGFPLSEKGRRTLSRPARRHGIWKIEKHRLKTRCIAVPIAHDRAGSLAAVVSRARHSTMNDLQKLLSRVQPGATLLAHYREHSTYGAAVKSRGFTYRYVPRFPNSGRLVCSPDTINVRNYIASFRSWLLRFRGVATRYLDHYLIWHKALVRGGVASLLTLLCTQGDRQAGGT